MLPNLLGHRRRILVDLPPDLRERAPIVKAFFYRDSIRQGQMSLIAFFLPHTSFLSAQARRSVACTVYLSAGVKSAITEFTFAMRKFV